jgi:hypothetical protein
MTPVLSHSSLAETSKKIISDLTTVSIENTVAYINTALTYVGGISVLVLLEESLSQKGSLYTLCDNAYGAREALLLGDQRAYSKIADDVASRYGVLFEKETFSLPEIDLDHVSAGIMAIANASCIAVTLTAQRLSERTRTTERLKISDVVKSIFDPKEIATDYEMRGASGDLWTFDNALLREKKVLFQSVSSRSPSVYSAAARFSDMVDIDFPERPITIAVLEDREHTKHLKLLEKTAQTLDITAIPEAWQRAAEAA